MKDKIYQPQALESKWYDFWQQHGYFKARGDGESYTIVLPPPNVTGTLHMGHAFQLSIMDALVRYHRMCGKRVLWQLGFDHAGIATQLVAENWLKKQKIERSKLTREQFLEKIWEWKEHSGAQISRQQRRLGISGDWDRTRFTLDAGFNREVLSLFVRLYDEGIIYRGKRLVNWDPKLQTAVSDLEVISKETKGWLWYLRYPVVGSNQEIVVATTRPETIFGDVAVAVHPLDERYQKLIGRQVILPLTGRTIPVVADEYVDRMFGTGCVKITPAHDFNDYQIGQRHGLPIINILTVDGRLNSEVPERFRGLGGQAARDGVLTALEGEGFLVKREEHLLKVPHGDRSGAVIEPYLTNQWFMATKQLAKVAREAVVDHRTSFIPDNWERTYFQWLDNIQDWCISRQLWWGHRIPAWYDDNGECYVAISEQEVRVKYGLSDDVPLKQDEDVLDTWFSSAIWPLVTLGWPGQPEEFNKLYPTAVLVTGFDIIFFWVARMMMMGLHLTGEVPFKDVYITGLIRDSRGQKMSKSKGNVLDPIDLMDGITLEDLVTKRTSHLMQEHIADQIAKQTRAEFPDGIAGYGADALRFTLCAQASMSRDINFDVSRLAGYRNFGTKLWNATRYVLTQLQEHVGSGPFNGLSLSDVQHPLAGRWMLSQLQRSVQKIHQYFALYRFDLITQELYDLIWYRYCDWYLEVTKIDLAISDDERRAQIKYSLAAILEQLLVMLHPFMPFLTEELWQEVKEWLMIAGDSIMLRSYPMADVSMIDEAAEGEFDWLQRFVMAVRNVKGELSIAAHQLLQARVVGSSPQDDRYLKDNCEYLCKLARLQWVSGEQDVYGTVTTVVLGDMEVGLMLDRQALVQEQARLIKEIGKLECEVDQLRQKLGNRNYCARAPQAVVDRDRERLQAADSKLTRLRQALPKQPTS